MPPYAVLEGIVLTRACINHERSITTVSPKIVWNAFVVIRTGFSSLLRNWPPTPMLNFVKLHQEWIWEKQQKCNKNKWIKTIPTKHTSKVLWNQRFSSYWKETCTLIWYISYPKRSKTWLIREAWCAPLKTASVTKRLVLEGQAWLTRWKCKLM